MNTYNNNLVSIITPCYNASKFVADTIQSVQEQTYGNLEMIIVDDCSTDNSVDIIRQYAQNDERIKLIASKTKLGAAKARNLAIKNASGAYIAFLDSDDKWGKDKLERQISFMKREKCAFSFSEYYLMTEDGHKTGKIIKVPKQIDYKHYLSNTIIGCLTVMIDRNMTGDFEMPAIKSSHDMACWLLILRRGFVAYGLQECLAGYRIVSTSNTANKIKAAKDVWRVYRDIEKLSFLFSVKCFIGYAFNAIKKRM